MQRYKLIIAYRGTHYHGWQTQPVLSNFTGPKPPVGRGLPTIQEALERCISEVVDEKIHIVGSSRTDTGVHAKGQLAHFDTTQTKIPGDKLRRAVNHKLPGDILLLKAEAVPETFHAILTTQRKRYQYSIWNSHNRSVFANDLSWHRWQLLDVDAMRDAANRLVGTHDFASFCRPGHGRDSTVRTVFNLDISCRLPRIVISIEGNGFLWNMVRIIVGTLVQVGMGNLRPESFDDMLDAKDRRSAGPTAPPHGLYLQWIQCAPLDSEESDPVLEEAKYNAMLEKAFNAAAPMGGEGEVQSILRNRRALAHLPFDESPPSEPSHDETLNDEADAVDRSRVKAPPVKAPALSASAPPAPSASEPDPRMLALTYSISEPPPHHPQRRHVIAMVPETSILDPLALDPADAVPEDSEGEPQ